MKKNKLLGGKPRLRSAQGDNSRAGNYSLRKLKAFGIWADRSDLKDPIQFTEQLRVRMEHGNDSR
jgi:hypothetical protein